MGAKRGRKPQGVQWSDTAPSDAPAGSFARLVPQWLTDLAMQQYTQATCDTYGRAMGRFAQWCAQRELTQATDLTRAVVAAYQRFLFTARSGYGRGPSGTHAAAAASGGLPLSSKTQRGSLTAIARFCSWAVRRGHLPANPASDLEYPRKARTLPETLTAEDVAAVLGCCDLTTPEGVRDRAFLEVLYSTGLRKSEALALELDDLDTVRGIVRVVSGKGRKDRYCPIGARALAWVSRYVTTVRSAWCQDAFSHPRQQRLFIDQRPAARMGELMGSRVHRLMRQAQIRKRGACHLFRHAFATHLLENGCDIRLIGSMLGHDDLSSTAIYTHVGVRALVQAHAAFHPAAKEEGGGASCVPEVPTKDATP